jgi:hypothetical protein
MWLTNAQTRPTPTVATKRRYAVQMVRPMTAVSAGSGSLSGRSEMRIRNKPAEASHSTGAGAARRMDLSAKKIPRTKPPSANMRTRAVNGAAAPFHRQLAASVAT